MIKRILLENYMSHPRTEIEPAAGLTVLVGPNNCGKSAVVSALETLARNAAGDFMIRHGEKEARVTVETDDDHVFVWRRKGANVSYLIDGREIGRLKRDVPDDLHDHLKLPLVPSPRADEKPFDVHFAQQKEPIFLLNDTESRAAMFFSASSDAGRLMELQDRHREKAREQKLRRKSLTSDIERIEGGLAGLAAIDEIEPLVASVETEFNELQRRASECESIQELMRKMHQCESVARRCARRTMALDALQSPPALSDVEPLAELLRSIRRASNKLSVCEARGEIFESLRDPPTLADLAPLEKLLADIDSANAKLSRCRRAVAALGEQIDEVEDQIRAWADANPNCPICGGMISAEALLVEEGAHAHAGA